MAKKTYEVASPITHDGEDYAVGESITLEDKAAAPLLAVKAIAEPAAKESKDDKK